MAPKPSQNSSEKSDDITQFVAGVGALRGIMETPPNVRLGAGITNRDQQIMTWRLPNGSSVQMYINPESFVISESKQITPTRTKGGYVVQYWGDNLAKITLQGSTGSSGVKGIQVLRDIYRTENKAFELVAASQLSGTIQAAGGADISDANMSSMFSKLSNEIRGFGYLLRPSLASLALSILLFYQGIEYQGFFTDFTVTESVQKLGLFDYNLTFMATNIRGMRENFMSWHKEAVASSAGAQLIGGAINGVGNAIRGLAGLPSQANNPTQYHPENAPSTFGGNDFAASLGIDPKAGGIKL